MEEWRTSWLLLAGKQFIEEGTGRTKMRQNHPKYAAMVETMDENVGRLLQLLKDLKIADNTIVIFSVAYQPKVKQTCILIRGSIKLAITSRILL